MGHFVGPEVTGGPVPAIHAGLNYKFAQHTLNHTASASTSIAIAVVPAGARVVDATLSIDNDALDTTGGGNMVVQLRTGGTAHATYIQSASGSSVVNVFNPTHDALGYRASASSQMWVVLSNFVGTGTATTVFSLALVYDCQLDGD